MTALQPIDRLDTHDVFNQAPPFENRNLFTGDRALVDAVNSAGAGAHGARLAALGQRCGSAEVIEWGVEANRQTPVLETYDRYGHRVDEVRFHPAYHDLMRLGLDSGFAASAWDGSARGHTLHAAILFLTGQADSGTSCPMTMTYAAVPALRAEQAVADVWVPRIAAGRYDPSVRPAADKAGVTIGMAMTEKQGGSDVRANTTRAEPTDEAGWYSLTGHKWFCSAPMCDAFLTLAYAPGGLTCFLVPRWLPDGTRNTGFRVMRLKDKMGDRSNASSEIEYHGALAQRLGAEGRGVATIIQMVQHTRLDCVIGSAAMMRAGVVQAIHHARHRAAFGAKLVDQDLMTAVLADLSLESEAATWLAMRLARAFDASAADDDSPVERAWRRVVLPAAKFWVCKRALELAGECMEVWGGNGYVETGPLARLYREAPVNSIWEGSGNVMCLDVLRAIGREPDVAQCWFEWLTERVGSHAVLRAALAQLHGWLAADPATHAVLARAIAQQIVLLAQAALLLEHAPIELAHGFIESRFATHGGRVYGVMPDTLATAVQRAWLDRAFPGAAG